MSESHDESMPSATIFEIAASTLVNAGAEEKMAAVEELKMFRCSAGYSEYLRLARQWLDSGRLQQVLALLDFSDPALRLEATLLLRGCDDASIASRLRCHLAAETDSFVKSAMVINIGSFGDENDIELLTGFLKDADNRVRANAVEALGLINDLKIADMVIHMLADSNNRVRANCVKLLYKLGRMDMVYANLRQMISSEDRLMNVSATYLLREIDALNAIDILMDEGTEIMYVNKERTLEVFHEIEERERLEDQIRTHDLEIARLEFFIGSRTEGIPADVREAFFRLAEFKSARSRLAVHRIHFSSITWSLKRQIEIEQLNAQLEKTGIELMETKNSLMTLNESLERRIIQKTADLQKSKESSERILHSINTGVIVVSTEGRVIEANHISTKILGSSKTLKGILMGEDEKLLKFLPAVMKVMASGELLEREEICFGGEGFPRSIGFTVTPLAGEGGRIVGVVLVFQDITRIKALETKLIQSEKMKTIGILTSSIAHDFNNMLMGILGYSSLLISQVPVEDEMHADLMAIHQSAVKAKNLMRKLLDISRDKSPVKKVEDFAEVVTGAIEVAAMSIPGRISVCTSIAQDIPPFYCDRTQIEQMILNLLLNASDAIHGDGSIKISVSRREISKQEVQIIFGEEAPGDYVVIEVADDGCGMSENDLRRIFDPFFTTKPMGQGTGLGCTIIYNVARKHGGQVHVSSVVGGGSVFRVFILLVQPPGAAGSATPEKSPAQEWSFEGLSVIVIEDEPLTMRYLSTTLEKLGMKVIQAFTGASAIEAASSAESWPPDLVISDMILPDMDGISCFSAIRDMKGEMPPVIFMSGHVSNTAFDKILSENRGMFIEKPFSWDELSKAIHSLVKPAA